MRENKINNVCAKEICEALGFEVIGPDHSLTIDWKMDSRLVEEGNGFLAIKGAKVDAHDFIPDVIAKGATCIFA